MREILFRGQTRKTKLWILGLPFYLADGLIAGIETNDGLAMEVIPETISQFIGQTDKNGRKIFEGDIVKMSFYDDGEEEIEHLTVYWDEKLNGFLCHSDQCTMSVESDLICEGEVVGNIHEKE